jgi:hypothetical protein
MNCCFLAKRETPLKAKPSQLPVKPPMLVLGGTCPVSRTNQALLVLLGRHALSSPKTNAPD